MTRIALVAVVLSACVRPQPVQPAPVVASPAPVAPVVQQPVNHICERFAAINPAAKCKPIYTALGELQVHTALIVVDGAEVHCRYDASMTGVLCTDSLLIRQQPGPPTQDAPAKKKPAKGKK